MPDTLAAAVHHSLEIKHSRFIAHAAPIGDASDALAFLQHVAVPDATHNCWAYRHGNDYRSSDDGEPAGTAGRPILAAIDGQGFDRIMVVVIRWYGGIKLGAGGLVRAYTDAVAQALLGADKRPLRRLSTLACAVPYALEGLLRRELAAAGAVLQAVEHGSLVRLAFSIDDGAAPALRARIDHATQGRAGWVD